MKKVSIINIIIGIILMAIELTFQINGTSGFICFTLGFILLISGIIINKKVREVVMNFIFNFF